MARRIWLCAFCFGASCASSSSICCRCVLVSCCSRCRIRACSRSLSCCRAQGGQFSREGNQEWRPRQWKWRKDKSFRSRNENYLREEKIPRDGLKTRPIISLFSSSRWAASDDEIGAVCLNALGRNVSVWFANKTEAVKERASVEMLLRLNCEKIKVGPRIRTTGSYYLQSFGSSI